MCTWRAEWVLILSLLAGACDRAGSEGFSCGADRGCREGQTCVDGACVAAPDAAQADAEPIPDGNMTDAGGPECRSNAECSGDAVCHQGSCCESEDRVCGDECCVGDAVCFANACIVPGEPCTSPTDCGPGRICQRGLDDDPGDPPAPPDDRVCLGTAEPGRCIRLPPRCDEPGADPETCILAECELRPEPGPLKATVRWQWGQTGAGEYEDYVDVWATPTVGRVYDTNCDGRIDELDPPAIVFVAGHLEEQRQCAASIYPDRPCQQGVLRALDGATGTELWSLRRPNDEAPGFAGLTVALGDVTGDGRIDIVAATGEGRIAIVDGDGNVVVESEQPIQGWDQANFGRGGGLTLGDVDGDGHPEIGYGDQIFTTRNAEGDLELTRHVGGEGGRMIDGATSFFVDLNGDGRLEMLAGRVAYHFDGSGLTTLWNRIDLPHAAFDAVADLDGDGLPEVVLVGGGQMWILDGAAGTTELGPVGIPGGGQGGPPTVADFTGDGRREIGVAAQQLYSLFVPNYVEQEIDVPWSVSTHDFSSSVTGSTAFDFEGDGVAEVVYADECFLWVFDGPTGETKLTGHTTSFTGTAAPIVADVDGDGRAEMVLASNGVDTDLHGCAHHDGDPEGDWPEWIPPGGPDGDRAEGYRGITVFQDAEHAWVGTRTLWSEHAYHVTNICSGSDGACDPSQPYGTIPERPRENWRVEWLNNFRQNVQETGLFDAPDATVSLEAHCAMPVSLRAALRNRGAAILPAGVRVGFFRVEGSSETLLGEVVTNRALFPGEALELSFAVPEEDGDVGDTYRARILVEPDARTFRQCDEDNGTSDDVIPHCSD